VIGVAAEYSNDGAITRNLATAEQFIRVSGLRGTGVLVRGLRAGCITPTPAQGECYIAHVGVSESARGQGIGSRIIHDQNDHGTMPNHRRIRVGPV
jgi:ribosomal protein S18 acetylase RimI-like enzyme